MKFALTQLLILLILFACSNDDSDSDSVTLPQEETVNFEILMDEQDVIWGMEFLPDQNIIFSERNGNIRILNPETRLVTNVTGEPSVAAGGEGGLLDLRLRGNEIYLCYTQDGKSMALGRGVLSGTAIQNFERIFQSSDSNNSAIHFGCRIEFDNSNHLFLSLGDQNEQSKAQDPTSHLGKILRLNLDGTYPADNPFVTTPGARPEIWSLGHRNPQGLAMQPETNELFSAEHGPVGGDELNIIAPGINYGWPIVTHGRSAPGFQDPIAVWNQAIAPSGMTFYTGNALPGFRGNLFIATLRGNHIRRIGLTGQTVTSQELLFENSGLRFRNVKQGPDELLYFSTDDGKIGRIISR